MKVVAQKPDWRKIPTLESEDSEVLGWFKTHIDQLSPRRRWQTQKAAFNLWAYLGRHWIEPRASLAPGNGAYHFTEIERQSSAAYPRPVTNMIAVAVDNEVSRLARKEYAPDTNAGKNNPEWMAAARLAKDILMFEMSKQVWDDKREQLIFNLCVDAIAIARTWWDENDVETTLIQSPDAVKCNACGSSFASARIPAKFTELGVPGPRGPAEMLWKETLEDVEPDGEMSQSQIEASRLVRMKHCPYCSEASPLKPFEMSEEEALSTDYFGRPLGLHVPRGEGLIDVVSIHEYFPENAGIGVEPFEQRIFSQVKVRPLEWIALRYPEFRETLEPEEPSVLIRTNPLYSDRAFQGNGWGWGGTGGMGYDSYYNHARVFETIISPQPIPGLERGAHFVCVNEKLVRRELCAEVDGEDGVRLIPRVKYHFARFKRIPGNFYGRTFVDDMIPLNQRLNEIDAQSTDLRERGKPQMYAPEGTEIYAREDLVGSMNIIHYDSAVMTWSPKDGFFPGMPLSGSAYAQEREQIQRDMQALGFPQDIEMGKPAGSVKTTSGLMLLSEEAAQKRAPRERSMINMYQSAFEHLLQLNWAFRREDATYEVQREAGIFERESYTGTDLLGDIRVKMAARINYDQTLYNKEAAAEALQMGLYRLDSPAAVDRVLDIMKLPKDVNENQTLQITRAEMAWSNFMKRLEVPAVDTTLHQAASWYDVLGKRWLTDEAYTMQVRAGWQGLIPRLVTWQQRLSEIEAEEAPAKALYQRYPEEMWPQIYNMGQAAVQQAMMAYQQAMVSHQEIVAQTPPEMPPPPPPPQPAMTEFPKPPENGFLPDPLEQKIYTVWRRMLPDLEPAFASAMQAAELGDMVEEVEGAKTILELEALMRMRAVIEAYRMLASQPPLGMAPAAPPPPGGGAPTGGPGPAAPAGPGGA